MDINASHVDYRREQLRDVACSLRWERRRPRVASLRSLRVALGRRLVLAGIAMLASARTRPATAAR